MRPTAASLPGLSPRRGLHRGDLRPPRLSALLPALISALLVLGAARAAHRAIAGGHPGVALGADPRAAVALSPAGTEEGDSPQGNRERPDGAGPSKIDGPDGAGPSRTDGPDGDDGPRLAAEPGIGVARDATSRGRQASGPLGSAGSSAVVPRRGSPPPGEAGALGEAPDPGLPSLIHRIPGGAHRPRAPPAS